MVVVAVVAAADGDTFAGFVDGTCFADGYYCRLGLLRAVVDYGWIEDYERIEGFAEADVDDDNAAACSGFVDVGLY